MKFRFEVNNIGHGSTVFTYPVTYDNENGTCSCGTDSDCSQPAAIYNDTKSIRILGIRVGCYPLNSVLQSTLECLYNQECIHLLLEIFNISQSSITAMTNTNSSVFNTNSTIHFLVNKLFIENWQRNVSYDRYFQLCSASSCSYYYSQRANFIYAFTTLIGLYGGLSISLRLLSPLIIKSFQKLKDKLHLTRRNRVLPVINQKN